MTRKIEFYFPEMEKRILATLCDEEEPELCDLLWENIAQPLKATCHNTLCTGDLMVVYPRPPKEPTKVGSQAHPVGRKLVRFDDLDQGMIVYGGAKIYVAYGDHLTEPVSSSGSVVAKVDDEYRKEIYHAGKSVWNAHQISHQFVTMIVRRKEMTS